MQIDTKSIYEFFFVFLLPAIRGHSANVKTKNGDINEGSVLLEKKFSVINDCQTSRTYWDRHWRRNL